MDTHDSRDDRNSLEQHRISIPTALLVILFAGAVIFSALFAGGAFIVWCSSIVAQWTGLPSLQMLLGFLGITMLAALFIVAGSLKVELADRIAAAYNKGFMSVLGTEDGIDEDWD